MHLNQLHVGNSAFGLELPYNSLSVAFGVTDEGVYPLNMLVHFQNYFGLVVFNHRRTKSERHLENSFPWQHCIRLFFPVLLIFNILYVFQKKVEAMRLAFHQTRCYRNIA